MPILPSLSAAGLEEGPEEGPEAFQEEAPAAAETLPGHFCSRPIAAGTEGRNLLNGL